MSVSVEKLLADAHTLVIHLQDHDSQADHTIASMQALYNKVEAMKQYQEDMTELNEMAKHRPRSTLVLGIAQENRQIRQLQQENRELQANLEEHQSALELIMQKYREHTVRLLQTTRMEQAAAQARSWPNQDSMCHMMDKIDEMAGVMQKAISVDETASCADKERLSQLETENQSLRQLLEICSTARSPIIPPAVAEPPTPPTLPDSDDDEDDTDTECENTVLVADGDGDSLAGELDDEKPIPELESPSKKSEASVSSEEGDKAPEKVEKKTQGVKKGNDKENESSVDAKGANKKATDNVRGKDGGASGSPKVGLRKGTKSPSPSKSAGDLKKTKTVTTPNVKKSVSGSSIKKETPKKSPGLDAKKDTKGKAGVGKAASKK